MERVADYIVRRLVEEGVCHIPMVTGRGILYLSDAIAKNPSITPVSVHHEQAAAFAAVAYSQYNGHLGACLVSTGCASTNALTGVLNAWQDGVPVFFLSGQNWLKETVNYTQKPIRTYGSQETNIIPIVSPITKFSEMLKDPKQIGVVMDKAIYYATHGVKGPVWLDVPIDIQNMRVEPTELDRWLGESINENLSNGDIDYVKSALDSSERPVVLIGSGVRSANALNEFSQFVEKNNIPVVFSLSAVDSFGTKNELSIGAVSSIGGTRAGNFAIQNSDLVISLGCRLSPTMTGTQYNMFARSAKLIVVDIDKKEHSKDTVKIDKFICADAKQFLTRFMKKNIRSTDPSWVDKCLHWKKIFPKCENVYKKGNIPDLFNIASTLSELLEDDAVVLCDAGLEELIVPSVVDYGNAQRCLHPASQGCMGVALPAAMGAFLASKKKVTAVIGDGSIMMNLQELQTIAENKMPIRIIIVNNGVYAVIRKRQKELFRSRVIGVDPQSGVSTPSFKKVADCFGIKYMRIESTSELKKGLSELLMTEGPVICEILSVEDQEYLRTSVALDSHRHLVKRPIEDLYPWLDREFFNKEMIVETAES